MDRKRLHQFSPLEVSDAEYDSTAREKERERERERERGRERERERDF